eukprot:Skav215073  [mRNA]  locus=scaffold2575:42273:44493:- [translate_table: standard]
MPLARRAAIPPHQSEVPKSELGVALLGHRAASSRRQRGLTLRAQEAEEAEPTEPEESLGDLRQMQLAKVPKHLWPFLMSAAQAAAAGTSTELSSSVASAGPGLLRGAAWRDEDGADWPREAPLRNGWQDLLREKGAGERREKERKGKRGVWGRREGCERGEDRDWEGEKKRERERERRWRDSLDREKDR